MNFKTIVFFEVIRQGYELFQNVKPALQYYVAKNTYFEIKLITNL